MELSRRFDGKKFMWDGETYPDAVQAQQTAGRYDADGFRTQLVSEEGKYFVFTRREIKETVVEAQPQ